MELGSIAHWVMVIVAIVSVFLILTQLRADHERSRRELAVKLLQEWTKGLKLECSAVVALVVTLSAEQCDDLAKRKSLSLDDDHRHINRNAVLRCLEFTYKNEGFEIDKIIHGSKIDIDGDYVIFIRFIVMYYLNLLESILAAWNLGVADESILEEQFRFLKLSGYDLEKLRIAAQNNNAGVDVYPSIANFILKISPSASGPAGPVLPKRKAGGWFRRP